MTIKIKNGFRYEMNGWIYISIKGNAKERGYAYGKLMSDDMRKIMKLIDFVVYTDYGVKWQFFIDACKKYYKSTIVENFPEFYEEMVGFSEGCTDGGFKMTEDDVIAWNNYLTLTESWWANMPEEESILLHGNHKPPTGSREGGARSGASDRCSGFIANGDWTEDGKIVCTHNNFSNFSDGQIAKYVVDLNPDKGHRILMMGFPGWIWSGTDFFVTSKGILGTETTIGGFLPYENKFPISCRIRQAMQYGDTLDDYTKILLHENSGDYANSWLFGDTNTNEIMRLELGLKYHNIERTKNGVFIGFNAPYDPRIRNLECSSTGFDDIRRHQGARRVRLGDLMDKHKGNINVDIAQKIISDHYDVYLHKENPCSRTCCSHYELDAREYMSDPSRPKPFQPRGAVDGNVIDTKMAKNMSFLLRWGNSCGMPFDKNKFCDQHREWDYLRPYLDDRPRQPWTLFTTTNHKKLKTKKHNKHNKHNETKKKH